ncbi:M15 family metallopeptidase [Ornithinibacillus halophilus]|uniref:Peptidoglycan L-alanyl-D-glutamate endopeptidase CwlK n=1 Tax=Ornithinibacillus halophilus TaxID=930117 RepID=A0A1M5GZE2_9BACI|nr:M15 family metallopeptidase [Ornithinibacillus halophilus]SHG09104.1 peptidoglycan L-alanyl-D-glutamate endopeptidase CwlK [Ornithinibacillus halophilus]
MKKGIATFIILCISVLIIYIFHYYGYGKYVNHGKNAPMPTELDPGVALNKDILIETSEKKGILIEITEGLRSVERQNKLYEQGRSTEGNIVTYAKGGESYHNYGLAIDFVLIDHTGNKTWDYTYDGNGNGEIDWFEVGEIAKELGFEWGGDWKNFKDYPHLEMTYGLSISQLQRGLRPKQNE